MKRFVLTLACLSAAILLGNSLSAQKYEYPFQNPEVHEKERIESPLSLIRFLEGIRNAVYGTVVEEDMKLWDMEKESVA